MNEKTLRKNISNLHEIIVRNMSKIRRLIVSTDFMLNLKEAADLIEINSSIEKGTKQHDFQEVHATYTEEDEIWFLWDVPLTFSNTLAKDAIMEMLDGSNVIIEGISGYKNK